MEVKLSRASLQLRHTQIQQLHTIAAEVNVRPGLGATTFDIHDHTIAELSVVQAFTNASAHMTTHFLIH